jgi:ribosomal protein S18 acetylase RimI-like enzyme
MDKNEATIEIFPALSTSTLVLAKVEDLIEDCGMECSSSQLPEYGFVAFASTAERWRVVGYIGAHRMYSSRMFIDVLVVDKDFREVGIATSLIKRLVESLAEIGIVGISSVVDVENTDARKLYEKLGATLEPCLEIRATSASVLAAL